MKKQVYCIFDHTAQVFMNSLNFNTDAEAIRWFGTQVNSTDEKNLLNQHPETFTLYRLQDFDDATGTYNPRENENEVAASKPRQVITGIECQEDRTKKFTVEELVNMLRLERDKDIPTLKEVK
jgi:hypothetical protein